MATIYFKYANMYMKYIKNLFEYILWTGSRAFRFLPYDVASTQFTTLITYDLVCRKQMFDGSALRRNSLFNATHGTIITNESLLCTLLEFWYYYAAAWSPHAIRTTQKR